MSVRRRTRYLNSLVDNYLNILRKNKRVKEGTIYEYRRLLELALDALDVAGLRSSPTKIGEDEIYFLRDEYYAHLDPTVNRRQIGILGTFLKYYDNNIVEKMHLAWPQDMRVNVQWLDAEQCIALLDAAEGLERIIIHLELLLVMRRCEVKRLTIHDVKLNIVNALGKGKCEGKWRSLPWARSTLQEIADYQELREKVITHALDRKPDQRVPDQFLIYARYGWKLGSYEDTAIDTMVKSVARKAGIPEEKVSNHVLRRSGARMYLDAGGSIEDISIMLGHADTKTTMLYLGISMDRLQKLQDKRDDYLDVVRMRMNQRAAPEAVQTNPMSLFSR